MNQNDIDLKKTAVHVGTTMLIFLLLFYTLFPLFELLVEPLASVLAGEWLGHVISRLLFGVIYAVVFIAPARLFMRLSKNNDRRLYHTATFPSKNAAFIIMATVAITMSCAYVNSWLGTIFGVSNPPSVPTDTVTPIDFLLLTFTTAIVPAFCEEILFRKTLLRALLPYGEGFAIISSALLFGLMHQNAFQVFYATMAGIVIGYAYVKTNSFLCAFLIHFFNNLVSVIQQYMSSSLGEQTSLVAGSILTVALSTLGLVSLIILIFIEKNKKSVYETGSFGKIEAPSLLYTSKPVTINRAKVFFLSPTVLIFTIISAILAVLTLFS